jgi:DNA polymerase-3 subunit beta
MQVQVEKFRQALKVVKPAVARKATLPVTQNVLVQDGRLHATNLELYISVPLPELDEPFTFPARQMEETLAHLPGYETLVVSVSNHEIQLQTSRVSFSLKGTGAEEFPPLPGPEPHEAEVDGDAFLAGLRQVRAYCATDESRPVLTGVCVALGDPTEVVAADGFRLGWKLLSFGITPRDGIANLILPGTTIDVLAATWRAVPKAPAFPALTEAPHEASLATARLAVAKRPMKLTFSPACLSCHFGGVKLTTQLLAGTFPNYKQLIPIGQEKRVVVDARNVAQALRQLAPVANDGSGIIRLYWEDTAFCLVAQTEDGKSEVRLPCSSQGGPAHIAFNIGYLREYFHHREGPVMLEVTSTSAPGVFTHRGERQLVIMPMFCQWEGDPTEVPAEAPPPEAATVVQTNDELAQATAEGEPLADGHDIPAAPEATPIGIGEGPAEDRGETTNPTKSRRKSRRQASPIS